MAGKKPSAGELEAAVVDRIRQSIADGAGKSMFAEESRLFGPNCRCGVRRKPPGLAKHVQDDGKCVVHPDAAPQPFVRGAEGYAELVGERDRLVPEQGSGHRAQVDVPLPD